MCFFKDGTIIENYLKMQESEFWIAREKLITNAGFYFKEGKLAIFCDGSEYHNPEKDKLIDKQLQTIGIRCLRFTGKEISERLEAVLETILN